MRFVNPLAHKPPGGRSVHLHANANEGNPGLLVAYGMTSFRKVCSCKSVER